jgi:hypothetical protein
MYRCPKTGSDVDLVLHIEEDVVRLRDVMYTARQRRAIRRIEKAVVIVVGVASVAEPVVVRVELVWIEGHQTIVYEVAHRVAVGVSDGMTTPYAGVARIVRARVAVVAVDRCPADARAVSTRVTSGASAAADASRRVVHVIATGHAIA